MRTARRCSCGTRRSSKRRRARTERHAPAAPSRGPGPANSRHELRLHACRDAQRRELLGLLAGRALGPRVRLRVLLRLEEACVQRFAPFRVLDDALAHVREADALDPGRRALEITRFFAVELQVRAAILDDFLFGRDLAQEIRRANLDAAVAADVQLVARVDAHDAEVLDRRFGAVARAARDRELDLVRVPRAPSHALELDAEPRRILSAEAAPLLADAGLHRAQRFAVSVARHETRGVEVAPDVRQILFLDAEQVDALPARDLDG